MQRTPDTSRATRITVGDLTFDARLAGPEDGPPVVLLHGFPQTSRCWQRQMAALSRAGFHAIAVDQRGYSPRARPTADDAYRVDLLAGDVIGVADALGLDRIHVVGHDWGGFVAWVLAALHADRVASVVSVSTPHPRAFADALQHPGQRIRSSYIPLFRWPRTPAVLGARGALGLRALFRLSWLPGSLAAPYVERARTDPGWLDAALAWYRANTGTTLRELARVGEVTVPTMYVWSTRDAALGPSAARRTATYVSGPYRFEVLSKVNHWVPELAPDTLNRLLLEHLASVG